MGHPSILGLGTTRTKNKRRPSGAKARTHFQRPNGTTKKSCPSQNLDELESSLHGRRTNRDVSMGQLYRGFSFDDRRSKSPPSFAENAKEGWGTRRRYGV